MVGMPSEESGATVCGQPGQELGASPDDKQGKPQKFHTALWVRLAQLCRQTRVLTRAALQPCLAVYFYHIIVTGPDQATRYTHKNTRCWDKPSIFWLLDCGMGVTALFVNLTDSFLFV